MGTGEQVKAGGRVRWLCRRCTACCRWPGLVRVGEAEVGCMAALLGLDERVFIERYTRLRPDRRGLVLAEQADGACIFLEGVDCRVQSAKPEQCRAFPNGWRFAGFEQWCRAERTEEGAG